MYHHRNRHTKTTRMQLRTIFLTIILWAVWLSLAAQCASFSRLDFPVTHSGVTLKYPWAGGVNAPQISKADFDKDGIGDIFIFDRVGDMVLALRGTASGQYINDPKMACLFPAMRSWALVRDFNKDGAPDIFTANFAFSAQATRVFKGRWEGNTLKFDPFLFHYPGCVSCTADYVYYPDQDSPGVWNNLIIAESDLPGVDDIDGDGDLDLLTFDPDKGGNILYLKNKSVEKGFKTDSLKFEIEDRCWGRMYESGLARCRCNLSGNPDTCVQFFQGIDPIRHPGSTTMTYDQDGDGDKEVVLGDISFDCLNWLQNGGTKDRAWMVAQDTAFPSYNQEVKLTSFPAAFYLDVDADGKNDVLAAPNSKTIVDDDNSIWYYKNTGSNTNHVFSLQTTTLWQSEMIDVGSITHPVLIDVNADGLLDLVAGNNGFYTTNGNVGNPNNSSLYLWLNTGTATNPVFNLTSRNWLNFAQFAPSEYDFMPTFGDLDTDGDLDLVVGCNSGILFYSQNNAGPNKPFEFANPLSGYNWQMIDVGTASAPLIFDLDKDGLNDLLIGERPGNINYFRNRGTATQPSFAMDPTIQNVGAIDTRTAPSTVGFAAPTLVKCSGNGSPLLVVGNQIGEIEVYSGLQATTDSIPQLQLKWGGVKVGERAHPALGDLNNDGIFDLVVGNSRGGFDLFQTNLFTSCLTTDTQEPQDDLAVKVFPNPSAQVFQIETRWMKDAEWRVFDQFGRMVQAGKHTGSQLAIDLGAKAAGVYYFQLTALGQSSTERLVLVK